MQKLLENLQKQRTRKQSGELTNNSTILKNPIGTFIKTMGIGKGNLFTLNWDESLYLVEKGGIHLRVQRNVPISLQEAYNLLLSTENENNYKTYRELKKMGFILFPWNAILKSQCGSMIIGYKVFKPNSQFKKSNLQNPDFYVLTFHVDDLICALELEEWIQKDPIYLSIVDGSDISFIKLNHIKRLDK